MGDFGSRRQPHGGSSSVNVGTGIRLGRYELLRRLGAGGMAEVHLARTTGIEGFEKLVVLKRILPHFAADPDFIRMFLAEARLAAILDHPNVVQVHDLGCERGDYYYTMEFVYGQNLQHIVQAAAGRADLLPIEHGIRICIDVAAGLNYAHERVGFDGKPLGLVHRDVSPSNVLVTYDGTAKVSDFGIAKVTQRTDVTRAGIRKGKVPYMSPEQCRAEPLDARSDVFALGIILYECTTLSRLFDGDNDFGVMNRIVHGDIPRPSTRRLVYPGELERIVMKALAVDREQRYSSTRALQLDLQRFARENRLDVAPSALASWMHRVFRPQPFPWGALQIQGDMPALHVPSYPVETPSPYVLPSRPELAGRVPASQPSFGAHASGSQVSHASSRVHSRVGTGGPARGVALGIGVAAGLGLIGIAGTLAGLELARSEASLRETAASVLGTGSGEGTRSSAAVSGAAEGLASGASTSAVPSSGGSPSAGSEAGVVVEPSAGNALGAEAEGELGAALPTDAVAPEQGADASARPTEAEAFADEDDDAEIVVLDEPSSPAPVKRAKPADEVRVPTTTKPRTPKPSESRPAKNLDAFMPGAHE